jgi:DNA-binding FadR family transcriptional regulator
LLKAAETRRLHRQIADHLRELIDQGEYPIGGRLPSERELADRLCVSRPSVREALIVLEVEGRIRVNGGSGIYVLESIESGPAGSLDEIAPDDPLDVLHACAVVESAVAAQAATLAEHRHTETLNRILSRMDERGGCADSWIALDREFHLAVAAILGNEVLVRLVGQLFDRRQNRPYRPSAKRLEDAGSRRRALAEHRAIGAAIAGGDAEGARRAMSLHLRPPQEGFSSDLAEPSNPVGRRAGSHPRMAAERQPERAARSSRYTQQSIGGN